MLTQIYVEWLCNGPMLLFLHLLYIQVSNFMLQQLFEYNDIIVRQWVKTMKVNLWPAMLPSTKDYGIGG